MTPTSLQLKSSPCWRLNLFYVHFISGRIKHTRATSPALRFHGDGGPFLRSCPPLAVVYSRSQQIAYGPRPKP
ncbi:hypothetical protein V5799_030949 [Amblyomma americanum]|uniref:Uncharacterized protein n=1 Tax=Amblyomma americanum TaxID=6943 RepID=A0AAQ4ELM9_AMBAM